MEAEKAGGAALAQFLADMRDAQREMQESQRVMQETQRDIVIRLDMIARGFPAGDYEGHRRYHQAVIERIELKNKLVRSALEKVVQAGSVAAFGWLAVAMWQYFKLNVQQ